MLELLGATLVMTELAPRLLHKKILLLVDSECVQSALVKGCNVVGMFWDVVTR